MTTTDHTLRLTNWSALCNQKAALSHLLSRIEYDLAHGRHHASRAVADQLAGLLRWIESIQDAALADGHPVVLLTTTLGELALRPDSHRLNGKSATPEGYGETGPPATPAGYGETGPPAAL